MWEAVICVGLVLGLIVLFRQLIHRTGPVLLAMVAASYAAYILHLTIVISIQAGMTGLDVPALVKFGIVTVLGVALAFGLAHLSRRVPGLRVILGTTPPATALRATRASTHGVRGRPINPPQSQDVATTT